MGEKNQRSPIVQVATLLTILGEEISSEILRNLPKQDVLRIIDAMKRLPPVSQDEADKLLTNFRENLLSGQKFVIFDRNGARQALQRAFPGGAGEELAKSITNDTSPTFDCLRQVAPQQLAGLLIHEQAQTIALVIAHLDAYACGQVVKHLGQPLASEVIFRLANLEPVQKSVLEELERALDEMICRRGRDLNLRRGGKEFTARTLSALAPQEQQKILEALRERSPQTEEILRKSLFSMATLHSVPSHQLPKLIGKLSHNDLLLALRGVDPKLRDHLLQGLSHRRRQEFEEEFAQVPPQPANVVVEAQEKLLALAQKLIEDGEIELRDPDEVYV